MVTTAIDATGFGAAKMAALAAHRTQIAVDGPFFALSNMLGSEVLAIEYFRLVARRARRRARRRRAGDRPVRRDRRRETAGRALDWAAVAR